MNKTIHAPKWLVILAFATVYIVWGSTYFFIRVAVEHIPAMLMAAIRFLIAGTLLAGWCIYKKENLFHWPSIKPALVSGMLLLFIGNGAVVWVEQYLPSSLVAVLVSTSPIWFVLLDKPSWATNFRSKSTIIGLVIGFIGVVLLFSEQASEVAASHDNVQLISLFLLILASMCWSGGSLYSKYYAKGVSATVNTCWQMLVAGIAFVPATLVSGELNGFNWAQVPGSAWFATGYLIVMGSLAAYSAYVWLLQVRPATQVSTYAYVNPVVAVLLGVVFANESMSLMQLGGLAVILMSVLLINLAKYRKKAGS
ncbi:EamA family transporter [Filimonas effusa]|uniref:EamA family transporter n=1 Tax=Filimonas effusa TaxID=2508721 RepID=A0A4Q1D1W9_9BACT|nr:EamA family transporter [Filimonas effusa]RXK81005.1 EamA family transporter [Filimonas effusa]